MKNEIKILIAALVVILIVLVGAFALSGSNTPQATATPTVLPVTATPTPVPDGSGSTATATPVPSVAPTATPVPSVTPTPMPESGVKLTEFGYWITYPQLDPQTWSTNPPPYHPANNVVYFDPTSQIRPINNRPAALGSEGDTTVYRVGDMNGTVNVTIHASMSNNIEHGSMEALADYDYYFSMHTYDNENMTGPDENGDYVLTFGPGVSEQELCMHVNYEYGIDSVEAMDYGPSEGWIKLTITGVDGGYSVGAQKEFTLSLEYLTEVWWGTYDSEASVGAVYLSDGNIVYDLDIVDMEENGSMIDVYLPIAREYDDGILAINLDWDDFEGDLGSSDVIISPFAFSDGQDEGQVKVSISEDYISEPFDNRLTIVIEYEDTYVRIPPYEFNIFINHWDQ